ncbi:hypothetical protein D9611_000082 [Ephemerocybe angulata]|uniref:Mtf2-like C-terminal domain-containing protein n=1 Tax=Ephemerocybe angulata TaxID=980116 RepID=A0A8H5BPE9_9AGAR|nr:hypothetical protein D9611_000082 [Tulosesus angulatus]
MSHIFAQPIARGPTRNPFEDERSIFGSKEPSWNRIFGEDRANSRYGSEQDDGHITRRQTMTDRERAIIQQSLDEFLEAKEARSPAVLARATSLLEATLPSSNPRASRRTRLNEASREETSAALLLLDEMKQAMELCSTKVDLLRWAQAHVFPIVELDGPSLQGKTRTIQELQLFQQLIPILMKTFRERFSDPNLALFIFKAVRNSSTQSYVYGCSARTYHEYVTLLWESFRDLQGVRDALQEMLLKGVEMTQQMEALANRVCREAMDGKLWLDRTDEGDQVAIATLSSIADLLIELAAAKTNKTGYLARKKRYHMTKEEEPVDTISRDHDSQ